MAEAYIVEALRTPGGRARKGGLIDIHPADLGATVLNALVERTGVDPAAVEDVIVGCVSQSGRTGFRLRPQSSCWPRNLPDSVPAVTIDRQCGSSQQALHFAAQAIMSGTQDIVIAAGCREHDTCADDAPTITLHVQALAWASGHGRPRSRSATASPSSASSTARRRSPRNMALAARTWMPTRSAATPRRRPR